MSSVIALYLGLRRLFSRQLVVALLLMLGVFTAKSVFAQTATSWRSVEVAVGSDDAPRVLWTNPDGRMRVWTLSSTGAVQSFNAEGPYTGFTPMAMSVGGDGKTRVLFRHTDGHIAIHRLPASGTFDVNRSFNPPTDATGLTWSVVDMTTSNDSNNETYVLWQRSDGYISIWDLNWQLVNQSAVQYGPFSGYTVQRIAADAAGKVRIQFLYTANGSVRYWVLDPSLTTPQSNVLYPSQGAGYSPFALGVGTNGTGWLGWNSTTSSGATANLWQMTSAGAKQSSVDQGSFAGWIALSVGVMSDGRPRMLWQRDNGEAQVWTNDVAGAFVKRDQYNITPASFSATGGQGQISLSWAASLNAQSYNVYRSTSSTGPFDAPVSVTGTTYRDTNVTVGTPYFYYVTTVTGGVESASTVAKTATATTVTSQPATPTNLTAGEGNAQIPLSWTASTGPGAVTYRVQWRPSGTSTTTSVSGITGTNYTVTGLTNGTTYLFSVFAVNSVGASPAMTTEVAATPGPPTIAPPNLTYAANGTDVLLSWDAVPRATSYRIEYSKGSNATAGPFTLLATTPDSQQRSYQWNSLDPNTFYTFRVCGVNSIGNGPFSSRNFTTTVQTPTLSAAATPYVSLSWTASAQATQYYLYRAVAPTSALYSTTPIAVLDYSVTTYMDVNAATGTTYNYIIKAQNSAGLFSGPSNQKTVTPTQDVPNPVIDLYLAPDPVYGGGSSGISTGTAILSRNAGVGGETVLLYSGNTAAVSVPTSITIAQGAKMGTFQITTNVVSAVTQVQITAVADNDGKYTGITVLPADLNSVNTPLGTVIGGTSYTGNVRLNSSAPQGGFPVTLSSNNAALSVPSSITVAANGNSASFPITTAAVTQPTDVVVTASANGVSKTSIFTLWPVTISSLWQAGNPISCGGIRWPLPTGTIKAGTLGYVEAFEATDFDQRDVSVDNNTATVTQILSDTCTYTWSASAGTFQNNRTTGRNVVWQAPTAAGQYTLTLTVDDSNRSNQPGQEGGNRDDAALVFTTTVTVTP